MKKRLLLLALSTCIYGQNIELGEVEIEEKLNTVNIKDVSGEELKSADLAESLTKKVPSISLVRRSGIANDIILRGQKKDNINILMDGTKTYGACPNRMDPATSHILTNNIESVEVKEGPFDVETFGTLSGIINVKTKKPKEEFSGEVNLNAGTWNYRKASATITGGYDKFRLLLSASKESSDQYEDGDGNILSKQVQNYIDNQGGSPAAAYKDKYTDMQSYDKKSFMGKIFFNPTDNQELRFSYTANRSDDILYPSSKMDALYDDSDIFNFEYSVTNMASWSKKLDFQVYRSEVEHPMSTKYRVASGPTDSRNEIVSDLTTDMTGAKLKNITAIGDLDLTLGVDASKRNWDGTYRGKGMMSGATGRKSIDDVDTDNVAFFTRLEQSFGKVDVDAGLRYDDTSIEQSGNLDDNEYKSVIGYVFTTYNSENGMKYFLGAGKSTRVPDARELYFRSVKGMLVGNQNLNQTKNYEIDAGFKKKFEDSNFKVKFFHSWLSDFISYNATTKTFENVDASIYGVEVNGFYAFSDAFSIEGGAAYQRGQKDEALIGQTDTDLAEIPPLKLNLAAIYETEITASQIEVIAADKWSNYDEDNGEQELAGYAVVNMKFNVDVSHGFDITVGVDNILDNTFAVSNTYKDLTLLTSGIGDDVMLMNEPGRYYYANLRYRF